MNNSEVKESFKLDNKANSLYCPEQKLMVDKFDLLENKELFRMSI